MANARQFLWPWVLSIPPLIAVSSPSCAEPTPCIGASEYEWVSSTYTEYASRYDLPAIAQRFLALANESGALKEQLHACREDRAKADWQFCDSLRKQLADKVLELNAATDRFNSALEMQQYLETLRIRLERRRCEE